MISESDRWWKKNVQEFLMSHHSSWESQQFWTDTPRDHSQLSWRFEYFVVGHDQDEEVLADSEHSWPWRVSFAYHHAKHPKEQNNWKLPQAAFDQRYRCLNKRRGSNHLRLNLWSWNWKYNSNCPNQNLLSYRLPWMLDNFIIFECFDWKCQYFFKAHLRSVNMESNDIFSPMAVHRCVYPSFEKVILIYPQIGKHGFPQEGHDLVMKLEGTN